MSLRWTHTPDGPQCEVRWRDVTGRHRAKRFALYDDAMRFDVAMQAWLAKRRGAAQWERIAPELREWALGFSEFN